MKFCDGHSEGETETEVKGAPERLSLRKRNGEGDPEEREAIRVDYEVNERRLQHLFLVGCPVCR